MKYNNATNCVFTTELGNMGPGQSPGLPQLLTQDVPLLQRSPPYVCVHGSSPTVY